MPTSATDQPSPGTVLLAAPGEAGWRLVSAEAVEQGEGEAPPAPRTILAVPGDEIAIHWLELAEGLAPAQAAAAARLMLADASAEPLSDMHVAVGRAEAGLTPVALVPVAQMAAWVAGDPDAIVPTNMLIAAPETGFVSRDRGAVSDYRGLVAAFSMEPELAATILGEAPVVPLDEARFEAGLAAILAAPPIDLRQGAYARRRQWRIERHGLRRAGLLALALAALSLAVQIATIMSYTFAADKAEAEMAELSAATRDVDIRPGFGPVAIALFEAVRATPNAELSRIEYGTDGSLSASVKTDSPATLTALTGRIEAGGLRVETGAARSDGGRPATDIVVRPS